jgi:hypothetical protein
MSSKDIVWLWYVSGRRGEKAHAFLPDQEKSICNNALRARAGEDVTTDVVTGVVKVRQCQICRARTRST